MREPQSCQHGDASAGGQQEPWQPQPGMCFLNEECPHPSPAPKPPDPKAGVLPPLQARRVPRRERNRWREGGCRGNVWIRASCAQWGCTGLLQRDGCCGCPREWGAGAHCSAAKPVFCRVVVGNRERSAHHAVPRGPSSSCSVDLSCVATPHASLWALFAGPGAVRGQQSSCSGCIKGLGVCPGGSGSPCPEQPCPHVGQVMLYDFLSALLNCSCKKPVGSGGAREGLTS